MRAVVIGNLRLNATRISPLSHSLTSQARQSTGNSLTVLLSPTDTGVICRCAPGERLELSTYGLTVHRSAN